jgi:sterol 3beta-glucosyltransferase
MINDNEHHQALLSATDREASTPMGHRDSVVSPTNTGEASQIRENVRATLSPLPAPHAGRSSLSDVSARSSNDANRKSWDVRRSIDAGRSFRRPSYEVRRPSHEVRRSFSGKQSKGPSADRSPLSPRVADSESATLSLGPGTESSAAIQSMDESSASASQILDRSDVFRGPANRSPGIPPFNKLDPVARHSQETTRSTHRNSTNTVGRSKQPQTTAGTPDLEDDTDASQAPPRLSGSSSALQDIASYPLQKATGLAGFLKTRSKRMGNLLASESMGYYEKVSGMLAGGRKHYNTAEGLETGDQVHGYEDDEDAAKAAENFRDHFAFPETEILQSSFFASLQRVLPNYGKIYISGN